MLWSQVGSGGLGLKQHYGEIAILCDLTPPTLSECKTIVQDTHSRCVIMFGRAATLLIAMNIALWQAAKSVYAPEMV